ncbi:MAG: UbiA family prenyltransferase [Victivallales bacterium]
MSEMTFTGKLCAWGRLLRLPNLFTAPWDPVCGFLIAGGASDPEKIGYLAVAALCAYAFGLVTNDIADLKTDTAERPARPLPSGEISMKEASIAAVVLCIVALELTSFAGHGACFGMMLLLVVILLYNYCGRKSALLSSALMGLCRVFSFGIGVAAVYPEIPSLNMMLCACMPQECFFLFLESLWSHGAKRRH